MTNGLFILFQAFEFSNIGLIFMDNEQYMSGCGHATIGISTALVELGMVDVLEPVTRIVLEPPSGLIEADVKMANGQAESVTFRNVPAFVEYADEEIDVPQVGKLKVDVAFGGNYFVFFQAQDANLEIAPKNIENLIDTCLNVKAAANQQLRVQHPILPHNNHINIAKTSFEGKKAVIPEITGSAHITGFHQFVIDKHDRLKDGFLIGH